jgi:hypothetical protein
MLDTPLEGLSVTMPGPTPIEGVLEIEEGDIDQANGRKPLNTRPAPGIRMDGRTNQYVFPAFGSKPSDEKGHFTLGGVIRSESYNLNFISLPTDLYLARAKQGQKELTGGPLTVAASVDAGEVRLILRRDSGKLTGTVMKDGHPASSSFVILAPRKRDAVYWFKTTVAESDGSFEIRGIAPGEYSLVALPNNHNDEYLESAFLNKYGSTSTSLSVMPDGAYTVKLDLVNTQ